MATVANTRLMTADAFYDDPHVPEHAELVDDEVVEVTAPPPSHGWIARNVQRALDAFVAQRRLGQVFGDNVPFTLGAHRVRVPDVSFLSAARVPGPPPSHGGWPCAPDLAVEVVSPSERRPGILRTVADYFEAGGREVWLIDEEDRTVEVHAVDAPVRLLDETGVLEGADALSGFQLPVVDVFAGKGPRAGGDAAR